MVLPAVLRDPARRAGQAGWRAADDRGDLRAGRPALARSIAGAARPFPAGLQVDVLAAADRRVRARLGGRQACERDVSRCRPDRNRVLLPALPGDRKTGVLGKHVAVLVISGGPLHYKKKTR